MKDSLNLSLNKVHLLLNDVVNVFSELSWFIFFQFFNYFFVSMFCFPQQFILLLFEHSWMCFSLNFIFVNILLEKKSWRKRIDEEKTKNTRYEWLIDHVPKPIKNGGWCYVKDCVFLEQTQPKIL